jgi:ribonuclease P protein component
MAVGKKIAGATGRSRGRRMLRESIRRLLPWVQDGVWLVLSLREKGLGTDAVSVHADVASMLRRAGLMTPGWPGPDWHVDG